MKKLLLVDGSNLLFQMFYGMPTRIVNSQGKAIQGTLGFVGALLKIIKMSRPTHLVVLFDGEHENSRSKLNPEYKSNRIDYSQVTEEENPFSQLQDIYAALDYMKIKHTESAEAETDDLIASYVYTYGHEQKVVIASFDSDFFQLISKNVSVLRYRGDKTYICDTGFVKEKYNILPFQYADFKSLTGDSSDNIKGADKVGPKTASILINTYGNLDNIFVNAHNIRKPSIRESIMQNIERLKTNYTLIKLDGKENLPFTISELLYDYNGATTYEVLQGIKLR